MLISDILSQWMQSAFSRAFPESGVDPSQIRVVETASPDFADYQCNAAMSLARSLKKPPRDIARAISDAAEGLAAVERIEVAGPGFINIHLKSEWIAERVAAMASDPRLGVPPVGQGKTVILDYSSPNVAKPMHVGHIRSTIIGDSLARLHRALAYRVISDNHIGDWGTQFGILIMGHRHFRDESALKAGPVEELERLYVKSYEKSREDAEWLEQCRRELVKLQTGDKENTELWQQFVDLSLKEFDRVYRRLGVRFDLVRGESHYRDQLEDVVERLKQLRIAQESEGAIVVFLEDEDLKVCIVRKSDGGFNYASTDLATLATRVTEFDPERIVYVTDVRQELHFRQIFCIAGKMGYTTRLDHVGFGLMRLPEGTFSTREGNVIRLERLLDEAESRALDIVRTSSPELNEEEQKEIARAVGIGAIKYADLSQNPQTTVTFTWEKALALDGNSGPYLQYAYARIASVRRKHAERFPEEDPEKYPVCLGEPIERILALKVLRFPQVVVRAAERYKPSLVADYLYDLCQAYSSFYQNVPFLKADAGVRESRVRLCTIVATILRQGLDFLGIETPERI